MKRMMNFAKRNFLEMVRDPLLYFMCAGFPIVMLLLFNLINTYAGQHNTVFELRSIVPGLMVFSFSFAMLMMALLVSKDRTGAFLIRLYSSPMKAADFVGGYVFTGIVIGIAQEIVCVAGGFILSAITGEEFITVPQALLLMVAMLPMLLFNVFFGVLLGTSMNDKGAPGVTSIFISASGILGGAWMPLDIMGEFEKICRFLPFHPATYIGRVITGAYHTATDPYTMPDIYTFDSVGKVGLVTVLLYMVLAIVLSISCFRRKRSI